jgi:hypothetical protein
MKRMYELLGNDNIINTPSSWNKSSLEGRDEVTKERSNPIHNDFSDNLVNVLQRLMGLNWLRVSGPMHLGIKDNQSFV